MNGIPIVTSTPNTPQDSVDQIASAYQRIAELESRHNLLAFELDGWKIWPLFRCSATLRLSGLKFAPPNPTTSFSRLDLITNGVRDSLSVLFPRHAKCIALCISSNRRELAGGLWKDVYFDDVLMELGDTLKVERPVNKLFLGRRSLAVFPSDVSTFPIQLGLRFCHRMGRVPQVIHQIAAQLHAILQSEPELAAFTVSSLTAQLAAFRWSKAMYRHLFRRTQAQLLLSADGYGEHEMFAAAKECGMHIVEFQHGVVFPRGPEYCWPASARAVRAKMPVADQLFVYGEYWRHIIDPEGFWGNTLIATGSVTLDNARSEPSVAFPVDDPGLKIALTAGGLEATAVINFLSRALLLLKHKTDVNIVIKLHPVYDPTGNTYRQAFANEPRVSIIRADQSPTTFGLIRACDFHLTTSYSCAYDSVGLGKIAIILPFQGWLPLQHLVKEGYARFANSPEQLVALIGSRDSVIASSDMQETFFHRNSLDTILRHLRPLMDGAGRNQTA